MKILLVLVLTIAWVIPGGAAGVYIVEESRTVGGQSVDTSRISVEHDRAYIESVSNGRRNVVIYRADLGTFYIIDLNEGSYREFSKEDLERMMNQLGEVSSNMQKMMEERMKNMTPEQRRMVEQMMKGRMGSMATPTVKAEKTIYRKVGSGERIRQWTCDTYEGYRGQERVMDVCAASWREVGVRSEDFQVFRSLATMFEGISSKMGVDMFPVGDDEEPEEGKFPGVPVRRVHYRNGEVSRTSELIEVTRRDFDPAIFELQTGWRRVENPRIGAMPGGSPPPPSNPPDAGQPPRALVPPSPPPGDAAPAQGGQRACFELIAQYREGRANARQIHDACPPSIAAAVAPAPAAEEKPDCFETIQAYREGRATADLVRQACPEEIARPVTAAQDQ